jgi:hypothetical protein
MILPSRSCCTHAAPSSVTGERRALARYIDAHNAEALALLERVVNINSGTQNFAE